MTRSALTLLTFATTIGLPNSGLRAGETELAPSELSVAVEHPKVFELASIPIYTQFDFLDGITWTTVTLETESYFYLPSVTIENRLVLDFADFPTAIPGNPGNPFPEFGKDGEGIGDLLVGTFIHPKGEGKTTGESGPVLMIPTATDNILGSGKWTLGPGIHISTQVGRLTIGAFAWNSWSIAGDSDRKNVNQFTAKPFFLYDLGDDWRLISIPLGITANWDAKSSQRWKISLGGGLAKKFHIGEQAFDFHAQGFYSVEKPDKAPDWSLRFTLELLFGDH